MLTTLLITCGFLATLSLVTAQTYYILPTDTSQCPSTNPMNEPCLTIDQYAQLWLESDPSVTDDSAISLIFVPGRHTLSVRLEVQNVTRLVLQAEQTSTPVPIISCTNSSGFLFESIQEVTITGVAFSECLENRVNSVEQLTVRESRFEAGHGIGLINVEKGALEISSFISLTASSGGSESGGALYAINSNINITECLFELNAAINAGGAIWAQTGSINIHKSSFNNNTAGVDGGAIYIGTINIDECSFNNNIANDDGGAIYALDSGEIHNCGFTSNTAGDDGGAIYMVDGGVIRSSGFTSNTANDDGGAIQTDNHIKIYDSSFSSNLVNDGDGGAVNTGGDASVVNCIFNGNTAVEQDGGAIRSSSNKIDIQNSIFNNNTAASGDGGAVQTSSGDISIQNSAFRYNTAVVDGGAVRTSSGTIDIEESLFSFNSAKNGEGGAIRSSSGDIIVQESIFTGNEAADDGGAVRGSSSNIDIQRCSFSDNRATEDGGAIRILNGRIVTNTSRFINNKAAFGGGVYAGDVFKFIKTDFVSNLAGSDGGAIYFSSASSDDNEITDSIFNNNSAENEGGAMYVRSSRFNSFGFVRISNNFAETGAVHAQQSQMIFFGDTIISGNKASFYMDQCDVEFNGDTDFLRNSHKQENTTEEEGGAITALQSQIMFEGTLVMMFNTVRNGRGGAILAEGSAISFNGDTTITKNTALTNGGIYADDESQLLFEGGTNFVIKNNIDTESSSPEKDCPDPASMCPDVCNGEQCPRYLNAECQVNTCHGLCTPTFFWNGRNVTDRCPVERCSDKMCPGRRRCIEEIRPTTCPAGQPLSSCRQHIIARCVRL